MEMVALEWIGSLEVEARDVVQFVQQLNNVPEDAVCEIGDIFSRRCRTTGRNFEDQPESRIRNEVHMSCEPNVAEFLCKKFGKQTQHVSGGEVIRVRCKRVYPGVKSLGKVETARKPSANTTARDGEEMNEPTLEATFQMDSSASTAPVLSIDKVSALIDLLGDQVLAAHEAYELFADADVRSPQRMTMLGLSKALTRLCTAGSSNPKVTVESLHYSLSKLIANNNVAVRRIPSATTAPFLSYTDFLACYVAFLANRHTSR